MLVCELEGSLRMFFLTAAIVGWASNVMKFIFLPSYLDPSSGQDIFYRGAVEFGQILVKLAIKE